MKPTLPLLTTLLLAPLDALHAADATPALVARELRSEYQESPLAIGASHPRLSWKLSSAQPNQKMTAY